jgi:hypothetical protein
VADQSRLNDAPPDPRDPAFKRWLASKPREWSVVVAARAALRVLPLVRQSELGAFEAPAIRLPVFRATAIAWFAAVYPNRAFAAAFAAASAAAASFASSGDNAAAFAAEAVDAAAAAEAYFASSAEAGVSEAGVFQAGDELVGADAARHTHTASGIRRDLSALVGGVPPERLARAPLWGGSEEGVVFPSARVGGPWIGLQRDLPRLGKHWQVWIDWYDEVLAGSPPSPRRSEAWEAAFTDVHDPSYPWEGPLPWDDGPEVVNLAIKARLDALQESAALDVVERVIDYSPDASRTPDPLPLEGVSSPIAIVQRPDGRIAVEAGAFAIPELPPSLTPEDLARTLATCRSQAERLRAAAAAPTFQGRPDYAEAFAAYLEWLPTPRGTGNILLADGEARVLNKLYMADEGILATGFAARLSVFLENHIGLRAHYDEVERLYQAVRTGRLEAPLQRDAVEGIKQAVHDNTPAVFDESVPPVVDETAKPVPEPPPLAPEDRPPPDPNRPKPPRDPNRRCRSEKIAQLHLRGSRQSHLGDFAEGQRCAECD